MLAQSVEKKCWHGRGANTRTLWWMVRGQAEQGLPGSHASDGWRLQSWMGASVMDEGVLCGGGGGKDLCTAWSAHGIWSA
jgi:hypothetical protein